MLVLQVSNTEQGSESPTGASKHGSSHRVRFECSSHSPPEMPAKEEEDRDNALSEPPSESTGNISDEEDSETEIAATLLNALDEASHSESEAKTSAAPKSRSHKKAKRRYPKGSIRVKPRLRVVPDVHARSSEASNSLVVSTTSSTRAQSQSSSLSSPSENEKGGRQHKEKETTKQRLSKKLRTKSQKNEA
jgi:hypothetical protein